MEDLKCTICGQEYNLNNIRCADGFHWICNRCQEEKVGKLDKLTRLQIQLDALESYVLHNYHDYYEDLMDKWTEEAFKNFEVRGDIKDETKKI